MTKLLSAPLILFSLALPTKSLAPEYILLTDEIGDWGGDIKRAELPDFCEVDYVRVYEMSKAN